MQERRLRGGNVPRGWAEYWVLGTEYTVLIGPAYRLESTSPNRQPLPTPPIRGITAPMALSELSHQERDLLLRCLRAAAEGPFFPDWEFHTLFGLQRSQVADIAALWPQIDDSDENVRLAIHNSFANLLGYPHDKREVIRELIGEPCDEIERVFSKWRKSCRY